MKEYAYGAKTIVKTICKTPGILSSRQTMDLKSLFLQLLVIKTAYFKNHIRKIRRLFTYLHFK